MRREERVGTKRSLAAQSGFEGVCGTVDIIVQGISAITDMWRRLYSKNATNGRYEDVNVINEVVIEILLRFAHNAQNYLAVVTVPKVSSISKSSATRAMYCFNQSILLKNRYLLTEVSGLDTLHPKNLRDRCLLNMPCLWLRIRSATGFLRMGSYRVPKRIPSWLKSVTAKLSADL